MTVHLLRTPDYDPNDFFAVLALLQSLNTSSLSFQAIEREPDPEEFPFLQRHIRDVNFRYERMQKVMYSLERDEPLSWKELFQVCQKFRQWSDIPKGDLVFLLTRRPNALNWFSANDEHGNVFVHTADWELFMPCHHKYPVAYQIWANILRLAMDLPSNQDHPYWHERAIGCMNDFCQTKAEIALKLRTGDICQPCWERLLAAGAPQKLVLDGLHVFGGLREQMLFQQGFRRAVSRSPLVVTRHYHITFSQLGHLDVKMSTLAKLLYLFYLMHPEGVRLKDLGNYKSELMRLYGRLTGTGDQYVIEDRINRLTDPLESAMRNQNLARANKAIRDALGESIAGPYLITGEAGELYRIDLDTDLVTLPDELLAKVGN